MVHQFHQGFGKASVQAAKGLWLCREPSAITIGPATFFKNYDTPAIEHVVLVKEQKLDQEILNVPETED